MAIRERNKMFETVVENYAPFQKGKEYKCLGIGKDWYLLSCQGYAIYVFNWVVEKNDRRF